MDGEKKFFGDRMYVRMAWKSRGDQYRKFDILLGNVKVF
jgi:hypothetical protein